MKSTLIAIVTLLAFNVFACPNLSGRFLCKSFDNGGDQDVTVSQAPVRNGISYTIKIVMGDKIETRTYIADGETRPMNHAKYNNYSERSFCDSNMLKVETRGMTKDTNEALNAMVTVKLNPDGSMYDSYIGKVGNKDINFDETCQKFR